MKRVRSLLGFASSFQTSRQEEKKIIIVTVDGEQLTLNMTSMHFFLATNIPGRSAFNRVGRKIVKLSKALSGVILKRDKYGSHLGTKALMVDKDLELKNFQFAIRTLNNLWLGLVIDGNPVDAEFIEDEPPVSRGQSQNNRMQLSYPAVTMFLQIVKCR